MAGTKKVIGEPLVIDGRRLSLSRAIRAGDFVFLTGQIPFKDGTPMVTGSIEEQTRAVLEPATVARPGVRRGCWRRSWRWSCCPARPTSARDRAI